MKSGIIGRIVLATKEVWNAYGAREVFTSPIFWLTGFIFASLFVVLPGLMMAIPGWGG